MWVKKQGYSTNVLLQSNKLGIQVQMARFDKGKAEGEHFHKRKTEYFLFLKGNGKVIINGRERRLGAGSVVVIKPNKKHYFINDSFKVLETIMLKVNSVPDDTFFE